MSIDPKKQSPVNYFMDWAEIKADDGLFYQPSNGIWSAFSWQEVKHISLSIAAFLQRKFLKTKNNNIVILGNNSAYWLMTDLACMMSHQVSVPIFTTMNRESVQYILTETEPSVLFLGESQNWEQIKDLIPPSVDIVTFPNVNIDRNSISWFELLSFHSVLLNSGLLTRCIQ